MNFLRRSQQAVPPQKLGGRYKVINQLGIGGFSQTFLAQDLHLPGHPLCVVKQFKPQVTDPGQLKTASRLFNTEAEVLYQLGEHPQIPRLLAHFEEEQEFYLVQEYIQGQPLAKLLTGQPWAEARVMALLQDLLQILVFVHQQSVIHRDIKPSNLIHRDHDQRIVLIDFGAVKQVSTQLTESNAGHTLTVSIGTQGYMPMEQLSGNPRFSSDLYAIGVIGIQAVTGMSPKRFKSDLQTGEIVWRDLEPTAEPERVAVSPEFAAILDRMVCYHFKDRYQAAAETLQALEALIAARSQSDKSHLDRSQLGELEASSLTQLAPLPEALNAAEPQPDPSLVQPDVAANGAASELGDEPTQAARLPFPTDLDLLVPPTQLDAAPTIEPTAVPVTNLEVNPVDSTVATVDSGVAPIVSSVEDADPGIDPGIDPVTASADATTETDPVTVNESSVTPTTVTPTAVTPTTVASTIFPTVLTPEPGIDSSAATSNATPPSVNVQPEIEAQPATQPATQPPIQHDAPEHLAAEPSELVPTTHVAPVVFLDEPSTASRQWPRFVSWRLMLGVSAVALIAIPVFSRFRQPQIQSGITPASLAALPCQEPALPPVPSASPDYQYPDGTRYYGSVEQGLPTDGRATMVFSSGNRYDGEFQNGQRNGCGTLTFTNGRSYMGQFKDDQFNGQGVWTLETGDQYIGDFLNNRCHGDGTFVFADGSAKQGRWQDGKLANSDLQCDL